MARWETTQIRKVMTQQEEGIGGKENEHIEGKIPQRDKALKNEVTLTINTVSLEADILGAY